MSIPEKFKDELNCLYTNLMDLCAKSFSPNDIESIQKAYDLSLAHSETKLRISGEPYILHHLRVAIILQDLIGLGKTTIIAALVHDLVQDNLTSLETIKKEFGDEVSGIVEGVIKISSLYTKKLSLQSENFITLILTISDDVRIILVKIADRLDNIRKIKNFDEEKQKKIAQETRLLYAPIAHRLGLYHIKTEFEDISLRHIDPEPYFSIAQQLKTTKKAREAYIEKFSQPIREILEEKGYDYEFKGRPKSVNSIYGKVQKKGIDISEIFDLFAIRIILKNTPLEKEKEECWNVYSLVTNIYKPNPLRLRDWISTPRPSGYESLHTTVIGPDDHWVEIQIRTNRMDEVAEKGDAAHWKYKESANEKDHDSWLRNIRDALVVKDTEAIDDFKNTAKQKINSDIFVFTPKGDIKKLRDGATILDFAYSIHSKVGNTCTGARVNEKIVPIKYKLKNGDTVEVITSKNQKPRDEWINIVASSRTKARIKKAINETLFKQAEIGKEMLERKMSQLKLEMGDQFILKLLGHFKYKRALDFYQAIADEKIDLQSIKGVLAKSKSEDDSKDEAITEASAAEYTKRRNDESDFLVIDKDLKNVDYKLAKCCKPIPGDNIFGFVTVDRGIQIHRYNCPNAKDLRTRYSYRIVPAMWTDRSKDSAFLVELVVTGLDKIGIMNHISEVISKNHQVNMRSIAINTKDGIFQGFITVFILKGY
jgi:guanosine-3',5'-bis(diphosphate) 3'-pyrophosphohydrolase